MHAHFYASPALCSAPIRRRFISDANSNSQASLMHRSLSLCLTAALLLQAAHAYSSYLIYIPNTGNLPGVYAIGHVNPNGPGMLNAFGRAFADADHKWTKELCEADSDGDGQTNGQELGDPCCEWDSDLDVMPRWRTGLSHPGDASQTSDPSRWANLSCARRPTDTADADTDATDWTPEPQRHGDFK